MEEKIPFVLGCDIGNAYAYASVAESADRDPTDLMPMDYRKTGMPTAAFVPEKPGEPIQVCDLRIGPPSKLMGQNPGQVVEAVKRCFTQNTIAVSCAGGKTVRTVKPEDVYASIIRDLVIMANHTRVERQQPPIYDLVFTYPAALLGDTAARERMQKSIESVSLNGHNLHVISSLPEPAAVALDYLYYMKRIQPGPEESKPKQLTVLVVDLGHGSLDLAVVTATDKEGESPYVVHSYGSTANPLGGIDFDEALEDYIRAQIKRHCDWNRGFSVPQEEKIRKEAKRIKHALSVAESAELELEFLDDAGKTQPPPVTRAAFEEQTADLLAQIKERAEDQLRRAKDDGVKIDRIILSGGGSNMPMIKRGMEELVENRYPVEPFRPGEAVSFGAARYAWGLSRREAPEKPPLLKQKANYSYGLRFEDPLRKEYRVRYLIPYQAELPATGTMTMNSERIDLDLDIRRSSASTRTGSEGTLGASADIVNKTFHGVPGGECTVTMTVDEEHHVSVTCRFADGRVLRHGTGKYRTTEE